MKTLAQSRKQWWKGVFLAPGIPFTSDDYERLYKKQHGRCANSFCRAVGKLHMDHDHKTGLFRGLICPKCNWALGMCDDNTDTLVGLAVYLKMAQEELVKLCGLR